MNNKEEIIVEIKKPQKSNNKKKKNNRKKKVSNIKKIKKQNNKIRKTAMKITFILLLIIIVSIILASSEIFSIKEISVLGTDKLSENEIISFSKITIGENMFKLNFSKIKSSILENPYVDEVKLKRVFPNKVEINVKERKVKYMIQLAESYIYIDGQGHILEISKEKQEVPILLGIQTDLSNINAGSRLEEQDLIKLDTVNKIEVTAKNYDILNLITKIDITDKSEYILYLERQGKVAYIGDATDLNTKILWVKTINQKNEGVSGKIFVNMDLNARKPYFRQE